MCYISIQSGDKDRIKDDERKLDLHSLFII